MVTNIVNISVTKTGDLKHDLAVITGAR